MSKVLLPICLLGCVSSHVFAAHSLLSVLQPKHPQVMQNVQQDINKENRYLADFTGTWSGTCISQEESDSIDITTEIFGDTMGDFIEIDGTIFPMNAIHSEQYSSKDSYSNNQIKASWNKASQLLTMDGSFLVSGHNAKEMTHQTGKITFTLNNGDLIINSTYMVANPTEVYSDKCVLKKQK